MSHPTVIKMLAKWAFVAGRRDQIDNMRQCPICGCNNRVRTGEKFAEVERDACPHFVSSDYHADERVFYFSFQAA